MRRRSQFDGLSFVGGDFPWADSYGASEPDAFNPEGDRQPPSEASVPPVILDPEPSSIQPPPALQPFRPASRDPLGSLRLIVRPPDAQVYVDGFYAGIAEQMDPRGLLVTAGWHRVELRAPGCFTAATNVTIEPGKATTARVGLIPIGP